MINIEHDNSNGFTGIDMTAMIDVVFTIIAFMMIMINVPLASLEIDLPIVEETSVVQQDNSQKLVLKVVAQTPSWTIDNGVVLGKAELAEKLQARKSSSQKKLLVIVAIDKETPVQRMIDTLDILKQAKISNVQIMLDEQSKVESK